ncbi:type 1 glutamine amidotransferase [Corallococcus exiguus]|uniref:type 1 glutamine amidotransferase domain-containing protein n=1 Tax=Corallococcus TaxID=83461 RepID=UPI000EA3A361|nr:MULTISPECIES: type 1 glutamine amidotransferase domain-containing protein [Corallococcus]RKI34155.1 type 1 glutamine amidotransferase [Corallococcus sp. AB004]NPC74327.1 type 1 glutamine amidotransferase [Corallococcus exiguus]NPD26967.1 type 1 glutamine amidotransferase [Corallococcus exiguus]NRD66916.1 type 1 glutamine amidotransferase [Corallococcus exiguus]RKI06331.1 type 1 glutamine amidotransferase [Corallococcus sp. AB030]
MKKLKGMRVAVLAADGFEQVELTRPVKRLEREGARVTVVSLHKGRIRGMNLLVPGRKVRVDATLRDVKAADFDALLLPGGFMNPDFLRQSALALDFVKDADLLDMPIAVICHGPWLLASAGLLEGRHLTSWPGIRNDMENAGAHWTDEPVVRDSNWVSSRGPHDLLAFEHAMVELFAERMSPAIARRSTAEAAPRWPRWLAGGLAAAATLGLVARGRKALV